MYTYNCHVPLFASGDEWLTYYRQQQGKGLSCIKPYSCHNSEWGIYLYCEGETHFENKGEES